MSHGVRRAAWVCLVLVQAACGAVFAPASRLTDFRLLAVQADQPYAAPGETVHFQTLVYEPFGRTVTWAWATCVAPSDPTAVGCLSALAQQSAAGQPPRFAVGTDLSSWSTVIPDDVLNGVTPSALANVAVGVVTVACPGTLTIGDFGSLANGRLPFTCVDAQSGEALPDDRYAVSVRHVYVRTVDRNANPGIQGLQWNDGGWSESDVVQATACPAVSDDFGQCPGSDQAIAVLADPGATESGTDQFGSPFTEQVVAQFYSTEGTFQQEARTLDAPSTAWEPGAPGPTTVWVVLRDNRGGVGWTSRQVEVR
jgi:hypothetical protein